MKIDGDFITFCLFLGVFSTWASPIKDLRGSAKVLKSTKQVQNQETELESLSGGPPHMTSVQSQQEYHYSNVNGKENAEKTKEQKVLDPVTGHVLYDIKEKTKGDNSSPSKTETKIDIPPEGIHKSFITTDDQDEVALNNDSELDDEEESLKNSQDVMASYLLSTGDFQDFDEALRQLVNSSAMTQEEADEYKENVRVEYNKQAQAADFEEDGNSETQSLYPYMLDSLSDMQDSYDNPVPLDDDIYQMYEQNNRIPPQTIEELQNENDMGENMKSGKPLDGFVRELVDEWITRALLRGDIGSENILQSILREASMDNDAVNSNQLKDYLTGMFANELLNTLLPRNEEYLQYPEYENNEAYDTLGMLGEQSEPYSKGTELSRKPQSEEIKEDSKNDSSEMDELFKEKASNTEKNEKSESPKDESNNTDDKSGKQDTQINM